MTNTEIIREAVSHAFTAEQIHSLATAYFSADTIAARASCIKVVDKDGNELDPIPDAELGLIAGQFHTFSEWKKLGLSVKKGQKAALSCYLWKWTDKPNAAARKAAEEAGEELNPDPHYYKALSHLFFVGQVERRTERDAAKADKKPAGSMVEYNRYLSAQRKAGNKSPLSFSAWADQQAAKPSETQQPAAKPTKKSPTKKAKKKPAPPVPAAVAVVEHHDLHETAAPATAPEELDFAALAASIIF